MSKEKGKLPQTTNDWLDLWDFLAEFYDTYGLPPDIIYCIVRDKGWTMLSGMGSERFSAEIKQMVPDWEIHEWKLVKL